MFAKSVTKKTLQCEMHKNPFYHIQPNYRTQPHKYTVRKMENLQIINSIILSSSP